MGVDSDLIRGHVDTIILNILATSDTDKYGYEIIKDVEEKSNGSYELKQPTLYSCLKRMENNELISSYWVDSDIGGRRRYYKISEKGREVFEKNLQEWLESRSIIDNLINIDKNLPGSSSLVNDTKSLSINESNTLSDNDEINNLIENNIDNYSDNMTESQTFEEIHEETYADKQVSMDETTEPSNTESKPVFDDEDYEQTSLFDSEINIQEQLENSLENSNLINLELETNNDYLSIEPEETDRITEIKTEFDFTTHFSSQEKNFFDANKTGEIKIDNSFPIRSKSTFDNSAETISFDNIADDDNMVNYISTAESIELEEEDIFLQNSNNKEEVFTKNTISDDENISNTTNNYEVNDTDYFQIDYDEKVELIDNDNNFEELFKQNDSNATNQSQLDEYSDDKNNELDIPKISDNIKINSTSFEDVLNETHSSIEKENALLFEKLDNIKTYTPRYTDTEYKNILGGLTSYSGSVKKTEIKQDSAAESLEIINFKNTQEKLLKEGITVKTHRKREKESLLSRSFVLTNKIKMANSWLVFSVMIALLACTYFFAERMNFLSQNFNESTLYFIVAASVLLIVPIYNSIIYFSNPMKKHVSKYAPRASMLFSLLFFVQCLVLVYAINLPFGFYSFYQTDYNHLNWLVPSVTSLIFLLNSVFYTLLFKSKNFHI